MSDIKNEIKRRFELCHKCEIDPTFLALEIQMCKRDVLHFVRNWGWTFDPRKEISDIPFILYDYQVEAFKWLDERYYNKEIGVIEKSRDMGATWIITTWALHKWIFETGFTCLFGSKTESDVDNLTVDSIFGKIRYSLSYLPAFLKPDMRKKIYEKRDADSYLSLINPETMNEISGDSANANFGRSGRRSVVFLDEFAFVEQSDKIWSAISEVSNVIIPVSTPNGKGNSFYQLKAKGTVPVLSLHWSRHPEKNNEWYENKKRTMEPHQVAQELDIDYSSSKSGRVYKRFDKRFHVHNEIIEPNSAFNHFVTWDFGISDNMAIIFGQSDVHNNVEIYACYDTTDQDIEFFIPIVRGERPAREFWEFLSDTEQSRIKRLLSKVYNRGEPVYFEHYGDFAGNQRGANSRFSVKQRLWQAGIRLNTCSQQDHSNRIQCLDNLFKLKDDKINGGFQSKFKISPDCERVIDSIMNYVWDKEDIHNPNLKPKHDWASHYVTALEFLAINRYPLQNKGKIVVEKFR